MPTNVTNDTNLSSEAGDFKPLDGANDNEPTEGGDGAGFLKFKARPKRLKTISAADIEPEQVEWFWEPYIPLGELTMIGGDPGARKSTLTRFIALAQAKGLQLPENQQLAAARVLVLAVEDSPAKTMVPQWIKWNATREDRERIRIAPEAFSLDDEGIALLEREIEQWRPRLVVIDPIVSFLGDAVDMNRQNQVRAVLGPLAKMAQRHNVALVVVAHARKTGARKAMHSLMGSVDFSAAVRSVLTVTLDPDDDAASIMGHGKANLAKRGASLRFSLDDAGLFHWGGEDDRSADELMGAPKAASDRRERDKAQEWLLGFLSEGPQLVSIIQDAAKTSHISLKTLERAKDGLGIKPCQLKKPEKEAIGLDTSRPAWIWLPPGADCHSRQTMAA